MSTTIVNNTQVRFDSIPLGNAFLYVKGGGVIQPCIKIGATAAMEDSQPPNFPTFEAGMMVLATNSTRTYG